MAGVIRCPSSGLTLSPTSAMAMTLEARICRDLLRRAGAPTRRGRGDSSVPPALRGLGVTSREMDVLHLVASGLSNADIAQRLYLSPRTVETHVSSLLARTGCHSRQELRGFLDRLTP